MGGQCGTHQRTRAGDGGEVMPEQHPLGRSHIIMSVFIGMRRGGAAIVQRKRFGCDKCAVIAVGNGVDAQRAEQNRKGVHGLAPANQALIYGLQQPMILHPCFKSAQ